VGDASGVCDTSGVCETSGVGLAPGVRVGVLDTVVVGVRVGVLVGEGDGPGKQSSLPVHTPPSAVIVNPGVLGVTDEQIYTVSNAATSNGLVSPLPMHGL
jgi:hypothetical protein